MQEIGKIIKFKCRNHEKSQSPYAFNSKERFIWDWPITDKDKSMWINSQFRFVRLTHDWCWKWPMWITHGLITKDESGEWGWGHVGKIPKKHYISYKFDFCNIDIPYLITNIYDKVCKLKNSKYTWKVEQCKAL